MGGVVRQTRIVCISPLTHGALSMLKGLQRIGYGDKREDNLVEALLPG